MIWCRKKETPRIAGRQTYGYAQPDGRFEWGTSDKKKEEIETYFKNHPLHNDFRDFFGALGAMEGSNDYSKVNESGKYRGIYQTDEDQLKYTNFFNTYRSSLGVYNMDDFQKNPIAQEAVGLLSFMGTPGGKDSRFKATAKAVEDYDFERLVKGGGPGATSSAPGRALIRRAGRTCPIPISSGSWGCTRAGRHRG